MLKRLPLILLAFLLTLTLAACGGTAEKTSEITALRTQYQDSFNSVVAQCDEVVTFMNSALEEGYELDSAVMEDVKNIEAGLAEGQTKIEEGYIETLTEEQLQKEIENAAQLAEMLSSAHSIMQDSVE